MRAQALLRSLGIVCGAYSHHLWVRFKALNWSGFVIKDIRLHPLLFSERNGYKRVYFPRMWWALTVLDKPEVLLNGNS